MMQSNDRNCGVTSQVRHRCGWCCLGPLTFHVQAVGDKVCLSHGHRRAERSKHTNRNGLVFSSRTVRLRERLRVRVEKDVLIWEGSLRVGFTNVSPSGRTLPLPNYAIPDLTGTPGHWAAAIPESFCPAGSELDFWVSAGGSIYVSNCGTKQKLLTGVDLSRSLWAMIDIYGQAYSISLLGSKKKGLICRRSCPAPEPLLSDSDEDTALRLMENCEDHCVVCMMEAARVTLPCGHRCLCWKCSTKVSQQFGTCPLCRQEISPPQAEEESFCPSLSSKTPDRNPQMTVSH
ncbi:E3 ubiquitin-protein ligase NEURL3-like [Salarias fasciatus]|uniref:E3 ubiquitin-protein ligase NEURL3-like n=1 Tax=Salarias fasciatus TaxID=181472 RepID=UPI001176F5AE|nr:E3 ubiquitin-protein ligase NEURL3-like [Salarias fasciatus]